MARPIKNNAEYFPHDAGMRDDPRIKALRRKFGLVGYALYNMMVEYLSNSNYFQEKLNDITYEIIAADFGTEISVLKDFIEYSSSTLDLFQVENGIITCRSLTNRMSMLILKRKRDNTRLKFKDAIFERDGHRCLKCGSTEGLVIDHIIPVVKGGPDEESNLQTLCKRCNKEKGTQIADYRGENPPVSGDNPHSKAKKSKEEQSKEKHSKVARPAPSKSLEERYEDFRESLVPYVDTYGKELIRDFFDYWTEKNQGGKKMKFELERTFEISKRLVMWKRKGEQFTQNRRKVNGLTTAGKLQ